MSRRFHVEDEAVDAVLNEGPQEPANHEKDRKHMLRDRYGEICKSKRAAMKTNLHTACAASAASCRTASYLR